VIDDAEVSDRALALVAAPIERIMMRA